MQRNKISELKDRILNRDIVIVILLFLLALGLRLIRLFDLDLNFDEAVLRLMSPGTFGEIWNQCKNDNFPPLYPWLVKFWLQWNDGDAWFRLLGAFTGALAAPAAYLLGKEASDAKTGRLLGFACALSVTMIFYSQFVRMFNIQPLLVCLSVYWFIKALKTHQWRFWIMTAVANLLGFYSYVFMVILVFSELIAAILFFKNDWNRYLRPLVAHGIFLIGVLLWLFPLLNRISVVEKEFWIPALSLLEIGKVWLRWGTGTDFRDHYIAAVAMNIPFLLGLLVDIFRRNKQLGVSLVTKIFIIVIVIIFLISKFGQSFVHIRYFLFITPLYLLLVVNGWVHIQKKIWSRLGLISLFISLGISAIYYYVDYYQMHDYYGFIRPLPYAEKSEGHALSSVAREIASRLDDGEVIIHYSDPYLRICTYYASLYYHHRSLREYLYSKQEIPLHNGRQYLKEGEWIRALDEVKPKPKGIWILTLHPPEFLFASSPLKWVKEENLPEELKTSGYHKTDIISKGTVYGIHFVPTEKGIWEGNN
jgi:4-amino-4-deoxy-L-arabinose transferase-like glycosyltransferase